jgi:hypothetical protein
VIPPPLRDAHRTFSTGTLGRVGYAKLTSTNSTCKLERSGLAPPAPGSILLTRSMRAGCQSQMGQGARGVDRNGILWNKPFECQIAP